MIQQNSLVAISEPCINAKTGSVARVWTKSDIIDLVRLNYPKLEFIIKCESGFNPNVCSYPGCYAGQGLAQIIPNTFKRCERYFGEDLDVFNVEDNLKCAWWLYQTEGTMPWLSSKSCWQQYY